MCSYLKQLLVAELRVLLGHGPELVDDYHLLASVAVPPFRCWIFGVRLGEQRVG